MLSKKSKIYDNRYRQIKETATGLFAYYGYYKTTLDDISEKVGIKKNSLYYYFESKEELLDVIVTEIFENMIKDYERKSAAVSSSAEKLKLFLTELMNPHYKSSERFKITKSAFFEFEQIIENSYKNFYRRVEGILFELLEGGIKSGELRKHDTVETGRFILEFVQAVEFREYSKSSLNFISEVDVSNLIKRTDKFIDLIFNGLKK